MKKAPLFGLIYSEYYLGKKYVTASLISTFCLSAFMILFMLSFRYGNLALLEDAKRELFQSVFLIYGKYAPIAACCLLSECLMEISIKTDSEKRRYFRAASPATGFRFAGARFSLIIFFTLIVLGLSTCYILLFCTLFSLPVTIGSWGVIFMGLAGVNILGVMIQVYGSFFHSLDKAGIAMFITILIPVAFFSLFNRGGAKDMDLSNPLQTIENIGAVCLPYAVVTMVAVLLLGFVLTGLLYQRKEK